MISEKRWKYLVDTHANKQSERADMIREIIAARARIAELEAALTDWHRAWITDCIGPIANGNTYNGIDEGIVLSCRMMTLILKKTRDLLEVNNEQ